MAPLMLTILISKTMSLSPIRFTIHVNSTTAGNCSEFPANNIVRNQKLRKNFVAIDGIIRLQHKRLRTALIICFSSTAERHYLHVIRFFFSHICRLYLDGATENEVILVPINASIVGHISCQRAKSTGTLKFNASSTRHVCRSR